MTRIPIAAVLWASACQQPAPGVSHGSSSSAAGEGGVDTGGGSSTTKAASSDGEGTSGTAQSEATGAGDSEGSSSSGTATPSWDPVAPPAILRTVDDAPVCGATPQAPCTAGDEAWLAAEYGSTLTRVDDDALAQAGEGFRLVAWVERVGPANIDVFVRDVDGSALAEVEVAFYFPDAPTPSEPGEWYPVKVVTPTDASGRAGFALGSGAYLGCGEGGPHAIWIGAQPGVAVLSDLADGLGMLAGTNHRHLDLVFQRHAQGVTPSDAVVCPPGG